MSEPHGWNDYEHDPHVEVVGATIEGLVEGGDDGAQEAGVVQEQAIVHHFPWLSQDLVMIDWHLAQLMPAEILEVPWAEWNVNKINFTLCEIETLVNN